MAEQITPWDIVVPDNAYKFLRLQRGGLDHIRKKADWCVAYRQSLLDDYNSIRHWLPALSLDQTHYTLDIGGGISGISVMLNRHYGGHTVPYVIDGRRDRAVVTYHRRTFNDMFFTEEFHRVNGIYPIGYVDANAATRYPLAQKSPLILSMKAWCFHFPPSEYLDYVVDNAAPGATLIVDVRKDKPQWMDQLLYRFHLKAVIHGERKYDRAVFSVV